MPEKQDPLAEIEQRLNGIRKLMKDPQPGLSTWCDAWHNAWGHLARAVDKQTSPNGEAWQAVLKGGTR